ncbi:UDP-3-O-(3-hydroxymyristoyl)glucosamine N-acyltransferase, partial [Desulfopila sp. IMCC35008]|uniref:UDP-3-O-(3-hydroxymyristoyl)glucosamine N-acyltransferase n=1 Tax=Desulfopila sp. IMCC35008 TaxID=2653858 RepID=UPI0013D6C3FB
MNAKEIAEFVEGVIVGDPATTISGGADIKNATSDQITFCTSIKYLPLFQRTQAPIVLVPNDFDIDSEKTLIKTKDPSYAFSVIMENLNPGLFRHPNGIHNRAVIADSARLGKNVAIGACAIIEENVVIGDNAIIYGGAYIGHDTIIGDDVLIYPNVTIRDRCEIGDRVIIHSGTVIGADGFGFVTVDGKHRKIPQLGTVLIEEDVEIGSNVSIDRARFDKTIIKKGTIIDNLVQIAHNVIIGENSIIVAQVGISGSTEIGKNVILAGKVGVVGHIKIGDNVVVGAKGGVSKNITKPGQYWGVPAKPLKRDLKEKAALQKLPEAMKKLRKLEKEVTEVKKLLANLNAPEPGKYESQKLDNL